MRRLLIVVGLAFLLLTSPALAQTPDSKPLVSGGQALWSENCLPCHGETGLGDGPTSQAIEGPIPNFADPITSRQSIPVEHFDVIKNGRIENLMPPWGNQFSDAQIWDAAAYVWRLGTTEENLAAGEAIYTENCLACHGADGQGDGPEAPAKITDFTNLAQMVQKSQTDLQIGFLAAQVHSPLFNLGETEVWQSLDHIRTFSYAIPQRNGLLNGQVMNSTTGEPVGDIEIRLAAFQNNNLVEVLTTQADSEGNYQFNNLATDHNIAYVVEGQYQEIAYQSSEPALFIPDNPE
ncbi:MAG: c-type cytochrome, partial [Chloroflexota bacterium]